MTTETTEFVINLDHDHRAATYPHGDITVILTWFTHTGRPVMVLVPSGVTPESSRVTPCLVPMDMAYLWDEHTGEASHCAQTTFGFVGSLGMNTSNIYNHIRVTSIIRSHLGDLLSMGIAPDFERPVLAEITKTDTETGETQEAEILGDV